jgi:hypothetical protein
MFTGNVRDRRVFKSSDLGVGLPMRRHQEICMNKLAIRVLTVVMVSMALAAGPVVKAYAAGGADPAPPPPPSDTKAKKKSNKSSSIEDPRFLAGYRAAYATIYDRNDYTAAIEQLKALGHDDRADVANLIGYSYRKLGAISLEPDRSPRRRRQHGISLARRRP